MLNLQQIENIIKPNKKHYEMRKHDMIDGYIFFFDNDFLDSRVELLNNEPDKLRLYLARYYKVNYRWLEMTIENNAIELKHYLDIEITQQDIIDWLNTILKINEDGEYSILTPPSFSQVLVEILDDKTIEIKTSLMFKDKKEREEHLILLANNSNDYWKLYNIIKNLKE